MIFGLQMILYTNFRQYESGVSLQSAAILKLENKNEKLQFEISVLKNKRPGNDRIPASISESSNEARGSEPIDMSEFYFVKAQEYKKNNQLSEAINYLNKIKDNSFNSENRSQALFRKVEISCHKKIQDECLSDIDTLISQYPESKWTGKALLLLSDYYTKNRNVNEAKSLKKIIQTHFTKLSDKNYLPNEVNL